MSNRALQLPHVVHSPVFDKVVFRLPSNPENVNEYFEVTLTPREARRFGLALMADAERAIDFEEREAYIAKIKARERVRQELDTAMAVQEPMKGNRAG